ncbi:hypothetical protein Q9295_03205 [Xinfangfangia sp. CPCC 101601]|uniref:Uncharacterized protein n=1 Tax=Pseudogemmobacter lacusdianii TaxID=3069608 RepID=A0ABU0VWR9_9RHOB|nr:hypothetical protein [Xinfangfangia sp. CPCC 101601]MDQ2065370.1 hypothetical protein [Xinfangfangia sp. CPCC 101601]
MALIPALWLGAALLAAVSIFADLGEISLILGILGILNIAGLAALGWATASDPDNAPRRRSAAKPPSARQVVVPQVSYARIRPDHRFGGEEPDLLQPILSRKMMLMEHQADHNTTDRF